jgi:hypothetical protein
MNWSENTMGASVVDLALYIAKANLGEVRKLSPSQIGIGYELRGCRDSLLHPSVDDDRNVIDYIRSADQLVSQVDERVVYVVNLPQIS